jgi:hypothetical protein
MLKATSAMVYDPEIPKLLFSTVDKRAKLFPLPMST